jgi:murein DD-endopeptidase MepM/ murein hydrolase activator NlpD
VQPISSPVAPPPSLPPLRGSYYQVQPRETLWRIAHDFGLDVHALARANRLLDPTHVKVGQQLFIPAPTVSSRRFLWPARGQTSRSARTPSSGIEIQAPEGSFVRASRAGRVAVAAQQVQALGQTVILDHGDGYVSVYAGLDQLLVGPGAQVEQGSSLGRLGRAPLYFEVRYHTRLSDPLRLLP